MRRLGLVTVALLIAGCGGGAMSPRHRTGLSAVPTRPSAAPAAPSAATGIRSFATVAACLRTHAIPAAPYRPPARTAVQSSASTPRVLLVMPWNAVQLTVYKAAVASRSSVIVMDNGAVMAFGNVALELDQLPEPPPATMRTIEACAFGR